MFGFRLIQEVEASVAGGGGRRRHAVEAGSHGRSELAGHVMAAEMLETSRWGGLLNALIFEVPECKSLMTARASISENPTIPQRLAQIKFSVSIQD